MNKRGILVMLGIACLLSIYGVYAEDLNLKITGTINNLTSDVYLKTSSDASISIDGYDFGTRNLPATYSQFYTTSSGEDLFIDAWNWSGSRTVNLTFSSDSSQTGTLTFSWVLLAGNYSGNFIYYGDDSSYTDVVSTTDMRAADSASADVSSGTTFYAQVSLTDYVAPLTCGDGTCNNGETCSTCAADCGSCPATSSGGGGGGSATTTLRKPLNLAIDLREVVIDVLTGSSKQRIITIRNPTNSEQKVDISKLGLKNIVTFDVTSFTLAPGESRDIIVNFNSGDNPGIDVGKIYIGGNEVLVSINSKSKQLLFDTSISVPSSNKVISAGEKLSAQINLMPMGDQPREDVLLNYVIKDYEGNILFKESETVLAENQVNFKKEFDVQSLPPGKYVLGLEMVYSSGIATSSSHFEISDRSNVFSSGMNAYFIVGGVIVLAILIILIIFAVRGPKKIISTKSKR